MSTSWGGQGKNVLEKSQELCHSLPACAAVPAVTDSLVTGFFSAHRTRVCTSAGSLTETSAAGAKAGEGGGTELPKQAPCSGHSLAIPG